MPLLKASKYEFHSLRKFGFGLKAMKRHRELIPLMGIVSLACIGTIAFCGYSLTSKGDVVFNRKREFPYENIDPEKPQKLITVKQEYKKIPELEALKKEIGSYKG